LLQLQFFLAKEMKNPSAQSKRNKKE